MVPHRSTEQAQGCLTSEFGWDPVLSPWYERMMGSDLPAGTGGVRGDDLQSRNRFYHKIALITESLLSQNRFYHRIAFITKSLLSQIRFQEGIATIELGVACLHYDKIAFITESLLSQR